MRYDSYYEPVVRSCYVCRNSDNHIAYGDTYEDYITCPFCDGVMNCVNAEVFERMGLRAGDEIPSKNQAPEGYVE